MITKSLVILSIICNLTGLQGVADKFDKAVVRDRTGTIQAAKASNLDSILPDLQPRPRLRTATPPFINSKEFLLVDNDSGTVLAKENYKERVPIASTTKIMTAVVVLEYYDLDEVVTVSPDAAFQNGSDSFLRVGEKITVTELLHCLMIKSGNDAAYALAEHMNTEKEIGIVKFVEAMNQKVESLGLKDTRYFDPAGLDPEGYSSAFDLYLITKLALKNELFKEIIIKEQYAAKNVDGTIWHELKNSNRLVADYHYPGAIGVKTGYLPEASHCLVGAAERNGHTFISIVLGTYADTASASADESKKLLDWGFSNTVWE